ncbi:MAG TPA: tRNA 2-selenouridine(34) synthase MnmH [Saprospiraceae bacterium]|nr:tRNA 2-selenouridine(34) synthase MnmH [Saprospiraceae bacterium]HMQ81475.1 tRNA 2-selenouridine(34) synthase MnmH [Saprospiraceae bacterium]
MAVRNITIEEYWQHACGNMPLLDVRTPAEYHHGHIPGAWNLPLFSNEERADIGTIYKKQSPRLAFLKGLEYVGPQMRHLVEAASKIATAGQIAVHCWRGGQRSNSLAWLLGTAGLEVQVIKGGYKAYRQFLHQQFESFSSSLLIVGGSTGSGKTAMLHALAEQGEQIIDLERLARHKGSAFGALGEPGQPTVEQFENDLYEAIRQLDPTKRIWLENESKAIGKVYIPDPLWQKICAAPLFDVKLPLEARIKRLLDEYACFSIEDLKASFKKIEKRLGGQHLKAALEALDAGKLDEAAKIALQYYDKAYQHHTISRRLPALIIPVEPDSLKPSDMAQWLKKVADYSLKQIQLT